MERADRERGPVKIAFLTRSLEVGGSERQIVNLAAGLHERGHDVCVVAFYGGGAFAEELERRGVAVIALEKGGRWDVIRFFRSLRNVLASRRPDVLYSFLPVPNLAAAFVRMTLWRKPKLVWGVRSAFVDLSIYDRAVRVAYAVERRLKFLPDLIVANSSAAMSEWDAGAKMVVVPNGIDVERFMIDREVGSRVRRELGIGDDVMLIGNVGRLDPIKDHATFLRAAARVVDTTTNARFAIVGAGDAGYERAMKQLAAELAIGDRVLWLGARSDMPALYNALDLLVSSSSSEAFPNVVAEAMACGLPCIVTNVGESAAIVADGANVVAPGNPEQLASAMSREFRSGRWKSAEERRRHIVASFSINVMIERTESLLASLVAPTRND